MNNINMNIEYYEDYDDELHIDNSKPNTGLEWNTDEYIHVDFINFPDIYTPFSPFIELLSQECFNIILNYLTFKDIYNLRKTNVFFKSNIDNYSKLINNNFIELKTKLLIKYKNKTELIDDDFISKYYTKRNSERILIRTKNIRKWHKFFVKIKRINVLKNIIHT